MTAADLQKYVGAHEGDATYVESCWAEAASLVAQFVGDATVPAEVIRRATLEVGSELYHRRSAPNGVAQFASLDGTAVRVARDPMVGAYPLLTRYVGGGFA
ncbi:hypothetical protein FE374_09360 [Georgenia yuyongxinii]|uniref:Phage gp6-like head-tail connector protein n=1 Tax=Georgenia yuyongxinii TaxID=2589797 RepID=A0A5B8C6J3_9MICO|nr:hypothetical protein [Georgenia yuyongxinii]QDC24792.1 hypothetical protein FE374_09360 [Georgenia yuyongxinii]